MMVEDGEVDEIDYDDDHLDQDTLAQTLRIPNQSISLLLKSNKNILEGHNGGRFINPCPPMSAEGVGNGNPDRCDPVGVAPGRVEGCSGNCGRLTSYK